MLSHLREGSDKGSADFVAGLLATWWAATRVDARGPLGVADTHHEDGFLREIHLPRQEQALDGAWGVR
jgi:hypothetical protein